MALTLKSVWGHTERPWGYEVRVDFTDDSGAIRNEVLTFKAEPSEKELDDAVASLKSGVEGRISLELVDAAKPPEPTKEELLVKVATLEAEKAVLIAEKEIPPKVVK